MKISRILSFILLLCLCNYGCKGSKVTLVSKQTYYNYNAESFGYSDVKKLYSSDSVNAKKPFFNSNTLQFLEMIIEGDIKKTILKKNDESVLVCYQFQNPKLDIKNEGVSIQSEIIIEDLKKPVFIQTNLLGKIRFIKFDSEISDIASGLYKDIISRMQFVLPEKKAKNWKASEENTIGVYAAEYQLKISNIWGNIYEKKILNYASYKSKKENQNVKIENSTTIETDEVSAIKKINTSEAQVVLRDKDTLSVLGSKVKILMVFEKPVVRDEINNLLELEKSPRYFQTTTLSEALSADKIRRMSYKGTLDSDNWETLIQKLSKRNNLTKETEEDLILKFRALFYLYPEHCKQAVLLLENELIASNTFSVLSKALSITETPNSIDALAMIIDKNRNNEDLLGTLIPVLTTTKHPTDKAVEVLKSIAFSSKDVPQSSFTASTAQLALGGMANQLRRIDSLKSNTLTRFLIEKMKPEKDTIQKVLVLGNTGSYLNFPYIKSLINSDLVSSDVKIEAISSLSLVNNKSVSNYLNKLLFTENELIKNKAQDVLDFQEGHFK